MKLKIANESTISGIHIWDDGTIRLDVAKWQINESKYKGVIHIYNKKEV